MKNPRKFFSRNLIVKVLLKNINHKLFILGFSSNPLFSNIGNVSGLASGSDVFSSNKLDLLSNQKQTDVFRNKMQDIFSQHKTGIGNLILVLLIFR